MKESTLGRSLLTAFISVVVTVIGGLLLFYFQTKEAELLYSVEKILPFESQSEKLTIYHITIENDGSAVAEDVVCIINISPALIKEYRVNSEAPITLLDSSVKQEVDITTSSLNPKENYRVSILASTNGSFPEKPQVKLRAKGISSKEKNSEKDSNGETSGLLRILQYLALAASLASVLTLFIRRKLVDEEKHSGDQNEVIAYLCGIHGLDKQVERYLTLPNKTSYWAEMDRLASMAIASKSQDIANKLIAIIDDLIKYAGMADSSIGIGHYNLARLYKFVNDNNKCDNNLRLAKKKIPKLLATRMQIDPIFKDYKIED
jgi:hypothetical protein